MNCPSTRPTRHAPTAPRNGMSDTIRAAAAPKMLRTSASFSPSQLRRVETTCTSFMKPSGKRGRIGRSVMRAVRISFSVGRPSRLKKPPGIFPAAAKRSRYSTERGKKSMPSRGAAEQTQTRTTVSPWRTVTEPLASRAILPVSICISRPLPKSIVQFSILMNNSPCSVLSPD